MGSAGRMGYARGHHLTARAAPLQCETPRAEIPLLLCPALIKVAASRLSSRASFRAARDVKRILRGKVYEKMLHLGSRDVS